MANHEQPTEEILAGEVTMAYLERQREEWLPLHARAVRAGHHNAEANLAEAKAFAPIDRSLDELNRMGYFALIGAQCGSLPA